MSTRLEPFGGIALLVGLMTTFFSLGYWGISKVPRENPSKISPKNEAFSIWSIIFSITVFKIINSLGNVNAQEEFSSLVLLGLSYGFSALWVYNFSKNSYVKAAACISTAALLALVAHSLEEAPQNTLTWISQSSGALLASWLCLASAISWDYAYSNIEFPETLPIWLTFIISFFSIYGEKPLFTLALVWASFFTKTNILLSTATSVSLSIISFLTVFNNM